MPAIKRSNVAPRVSSDASSGQPTASQKKRAAPKRKDMELAQEQEPGGRKVVVDDQAIPAAPGDTNEPQEVEVDGHHVDISKLTVPSDEPTARELAQQKGCFGGL